MSLARCYTHNIKNVRLLRYPDAAVAARAARLVQLEVGRDYSIARAIHSVLPATVLDRVSDKGVICSALVAQAFLTAGADIFGQTAIERTTPATLEKLVGLEDITAIAFRSALAPNNIEDMSALDGDRAPTPSARQTKLSAACSRLFWDEADAIAKAYPEAELQPLPTYFGMLDFVLKAQGRRSRIPEDRRRAFERLIADFDERLAAYVDGGDLRNMMRELTEYDDRIMQRNLIESFKAAPDIDREAMRSYLAAGRGQLTQRERSIAEWENDPHNVSKAMAANIVFDRAAADATRRRNALLEEILTRLGVAYS